MVNKWLTSPARVKEIEESVNFRWPDLAPPMLPQGGNPAVATDNRGDFRADRSPWRGPVRRTKRRAGIATLARPVNLKLKAAGLELVLVEKASIGAVCLLHCLSRHSIADARRLRPNGVGIGATQASAHDALPMRWLVRAMFQLT